VQQRGHDPCADRARLALAQDVADPLVRAKFLPSNIGTNGEGPTGTSPTVYVAGNAAALNSVGGINLGTGRDFFITGVNVTDA
jgi:hypothetical protein